MHNAPVFRAFTGLSYFKEAQSSPLTIPWPSGGTIKLSYVNDTPEAQMKLQECFALKEHPTLCEGRLPVQLQLCSPDGKRFANMTNWPAFAAREWPKQRQAVAKTFPSVMWR